MNTAHPPTTRSRALAHVARLAVGPALDPALRVSLNFHPDRVVGGVPILCMGR